MATSRAVSGITESKFVSTAARSSRGIIRKFRNSRYIHRRKHSASSVRGKWLAGRKSERWRMRRRKAEVNLRSRAQANGVSTKGRTHAYGRSLSEIVDATDAGKIRPLFAFELSNSAPCFLPTAPTRVTKV